MTNKEFMIESKKIVADSIESAIIKWLECRYVSDGGWFKKVPHPSSIKSIKAQVTKLGWVATIEYSGSPSVETVFVAPVNWYAKKLFRENLIDEIVKAINQSQKSLLGQLETGLLDNEILETGIVIGQLQDYISKVFCPENDKEIIDIIVGYVEKLVRDPSISINVAIVVANRVKTIVHNRKCAGKRRLLILALAIYDLIYPGKADQLDQKSVFHVMLNQDPTVLLLINKLQYEFGLVEKEV